MAFALKKLIAIQRLKIHPIFNKYNFNKYTIQYWKKEHLSPPQCTFLHLLSSNEDNLLLAKTWGLYWALSAGGARTQAVWSSFISCLHVVSRFLRYSFVNLKEKLQAWPTLSCAGITKQDCIGEDRIITSY